MIALCYGTVHFSDSSRKPLLKNTYIWWDTLLENMMWRLSVMNECSNDVLLGQLFLRKRHWLDLKLSNGKPGFSTSQNSVDLGWIWTCDLMKIHL